jgi:hypothetical protein
MAESAVNVIQAMYVTPLRAKLFAAMARSLLLALTPSSLLIWKEKIRLV